MLQIQFLRHLIWLWIRKLIITYKLKCLYQLILSWERVKMFARINRHPAKFSPPKQPWKARFYYFSQKLNVTHRDGNMKAKHDEQHALLKRKVIKLKAKFKNLKVALRKPPAPAVGRVCEEITHQSHTTVVWTEKRAAWGKLWQAVVTIKLGALLMPYTTSKLTWRHTQSGSSCKNWKQSASDNQSKLILL